MQLRDVALPPTIQIRPPQVCITEKETLPWDPALGFGKHSWNRSQSQVISRNAFSETDMKMTFPLLFPLACPYTFLCYLSVLPGIFSLCCAVPMISAFSRVLPSTQNRTKPFVLHTSPPGTRERVRVHQRGTPWRQISPTYLFQPFIPHSTAVLPTAEMLPENLSQTNKSCRFRWCFILRSHVKHMWTGTIPIIYSD